MGSNLTRGTNVSVAQLEEHTATNGEVEGSNPFRNSKTMDKYLMLEKG